MNIGTRIKDLRLEKGLTQKELSESLNLSIDMIGSIEQGRKFPSLESLVNIADFFECTTDYLMGRTDSLQEEIPITWPVFNKALLDLLDEIAPFNPEAAQKVRDLYNTLPQEDREITPEEGEEFGEIIRPYTERLEKYFKDEEKETP